MAVSVDRSLFRTQRRSLHVDEVWSLTRTQRRSLHVDELRTLTRTQQRSLHVDELRTLIRTQQRSLHVDEVWSLTRTQQRSLHVDKVWSLTRTQWRSFMSTLHSDRTTGTNSRHSLTLRRIHGTTCPRIPPHGQGRRKGDKGEKRVGQGGRGEDCRLELNTRSKYLKTCRYEGTTCPQS